MTIQQLLEKLQAKRNALDSAIAEIIAFQGTSTIRTKAKAILQSIKPRKKQYRYTKKRPHWMQRPENKAKVIAMAKARAAKRKQNK